ncbi:Sec-independent protein secretion pathway component TatC [Paenibacillus baekrokdamisoli]|nr:Sec-independent protein secretion pathway component TatC [Paenibacillus baekrokdamisoli]
MVSRDIKVLLVVVVLFVIGVVISYFLTRPLFY